MPCFVVNYFEYRPYDDISQTCTSVNSYSWCENLATGTAFSVYYSNGSLAGTHDPKGVAHPCVDHNFMCLQSSCVQGDLQGCYDACASLNLLDNYNYTCYGNCDCNCGTKECG